jgi:phage gpG-like protein
MAVRLSGDFDRLERLIARAGRIASDSFRRELLWNIAHEVNRQIGDEFRLGQDPNGKPWQPLRSRPGGRPLVKSGKLQRAAQSAVPTPTGVMVQIDLVQAATQNYGARIRAKNVKALRFRVGRRWVFAKSVTIPARPFLPEGDLPQRWRDGIAVVVTTSLSRTLRGV